MRIVVASPQVPQPIAGETMFPPRAPFFGR
jgi:hypothetical protein